MKATLHLSDAVNASSPSLLLPPFSSCPGVHLTLTGHPLGPVNAVLLLQRLAVLPLVNTVKLVAAEWTSGSGSSTTQAPSTTATAAGGVRRSAEAQERAVRQAVEAAVVAERRASHM
jgi:hypothetical protein